MLHEIFNPLNYVLFHLINDEVSISELLGFITGAWCVWLTVKAKVLNFPVGIANSFFFLLLFLNAGLYADSALQIVYIVLGFFGWYAWLKFGPQKTELEVTSSWRWLAWGAVGSVAMTAGLWPILLSVHDIAPFLDALTTGLSLSAQTLLSFKKFQNWFLWIAADLIYIPLYVSKGLALTSGVYIIFLCMCFAGIKQWREAIVDKPKKSIILKPVIVG
jgi:nicotinamide mononucleotide transporter